MSDKIKIPGPEMSYVDIINEETIASINKEKEGNYYPLRPSAAGKCTRELAFQLAEYYDIAKYPKKPMEAETHRIFGLGNSVEYHTIQQIKSHVKSFEVRYKQAVVELFVLKSPNLEPKGRLIEGSLDGVFWSEQFRTLIDFKSKKDKFSAFYKTNWDEISEKLASKEYVTQIGHDSWYITDLDTLIEEWGDPWLIENFMQMNCYAHSEFCIKRGIDHCAVIQYNKNDSRMREIRFSPSQKAFEATKARFQNALNAVDNGDPMKAPKDFNLGSAKCAFCPYSAQCYNDDTLKAYFKTFPKKTWPTDVETLGEDIAEAFEAYEKSEATYTADQAATQELIDYLTKNEITKVKLRNGRVYEVKYLKTPKPHFELRRTKL
jgi:hypothetical protein